MVNSKWTKKKRKRKRKGRDIENPYVPTGGILKFVLVVPFE